MEDHIIKEPSASYDTYYRYSDYLKFSYDEMVEIIKSRIFKLSPAPFSTHQRILRKIVTSIVY